MCKEENDVSVGRQIVDVARARFRTAAAAAEWNVVAERSAVRLGTLGVLTRFSLAPPGKCQDNALIRQRPLSFISFPTH
jgi:hypothetical protein